jgi:predicted acyl esterase
MDAQAHGCSDVTEVEHLWIPLADGCRLAARLWLPSDAQDNPVPAVLEYIPYRKRDVTALRDDTMHPMSRPAAMPACASTCAATGSPTG